jgi:mono/diheme cytochrome c family protein
MKNLRKLATVVIMAGTAISSVAQGSGADTYKTNCLMCHGADGTGNTPAGKALKATSLSSPSVTKQSSADLMATIKSGKGKMPAYGTKLTHEQIEGVVEYIRTLEKK